MSNLLKSYHVVCANSDKRIIDTNQAMSEAIVRIKEQIETQSYEANVDFVQGLDVANVEELLYSENDETGEQIIAGNVIHADGDFAPKQEIDLSIIDEKIAEAEEQAKFIIDNAKGDADAIVLEARKKAEEILDEAKNSGFEQGYSEGKQKADAETQTKLDEIEQLKTQLMSNYQEKVKTLEADLVDVILKVINDVTHVISEDKVDLVAGLIRTVIDDDVTSDSFVIRVSKEDAEFVKNNKDKIIDDVAKINDIIVVEDGTMKKGQCMVETNFGIYDCSLDVQLEALIKEIKLLACAVGNE